MVLLLLGGEERGVGVPRVGVAERRGAESKGGGGSAQPKPKGRVELLLLH